MTDFPGLYKVMGGPHLVQNGHCGVVVMQVVQVDVVRLQPLERVGQAALALASDRPLRLG